MIITRSSPQCVCQQTLSWWCLMITTGYAPPVLRNTAQLVPKPQKLRFKLHWLELSHGLSWHIDWHSEETAPHNHQQHRPPFQELPFSPAHPPRCAAPHTRRASGTVRQQKVALADRKKTKIHSESKHYFDGGLPERHRLRRTRSW